MGRTSNKDEEMVRKMNIIELCRTRRAARKVLRKIDEIKPPTREKYGEEHPTIVNDSYLLEIGMRLESDNVYDKRWFIRDLQILSRTYFHDQDKETYTQGHGPVIIENPNRLKDEIKERLFL